MIPREILKQIQQIEIRTNRLVTEFSERGCVQSTSRSTPDISNPPTSRLKAELQTASAARCRSRNTHYASRIAP